MKRPVDLEMIWDIIFSVSAVEVLTFYLLDKQNLDNFFHRLTIVLWSVFFFNSVNWNDVCIVWSTYVPVCFTT